jgi:hypothetical protein
MGVGVVSMDYGSKEMGGGVLSTHLLGLTFIAKEECHQILKVT